MKDALMAAARQSYLPCPTGLNFSDQMGTGVFPWKSRTASYVAQMDLIE